MALIGRYEILGTLGSGSMGAVYRARDPMLGREIALKTICQDGVDADVRARFYQEARTGALLQHPNIVTVFDLGEAGGMTYIAMELLRGEDLQHVVETKQPFPLETKLAFMIDICRALDYAHRRGVVHRDIKPSNIFIAGGASAKVLDFGVARLPSSTLTQTGAVLGTPNYMAPEQISASSCDGRTDLFALAIVFFEFLTGIHPFRSLFIPSRIVSGRPEPLRDVAPRLPLSLDAVLARALQKEPDSRYQTGGEFAEDLERVLAEVRAGGGSDHSPTPPPVDSEPEVQSAPPAPAQSGAGAPAPPPTELGRPAMPAPAIGSIDATQVIDYRAGDPWPPKPNGAPARPARPERPRTSVPKVATAPPKAPPSKPRTKIRAVVFGLIAIAVIAAGVLFYYAYYAGPNGILNPVATADVMAPEAKLVREPAPAARTLLALHRGDRVNVLEFPFSARPLWVHVQRVSGGSASPPGYMRASDLGNWSVVSLWLMFGPDDTAPTARRAEYVGALETLVARTPGSADANRAYLRIAEQSVMLARAAKEAGQPPGEWLKHADRALRALRAAGSLDAVAQELRRTIESLRHTEVRPSDSHLVPEVKREQNANHPPPAPYDPEPDYLLAEQDWQAARYDSAERRLLRILKLSPNFQKAAALLQKVRTAQLVDPGVC